MLNFNLPNKSSEAKKLKLLLSNGCKTNFFFFFQKWQLLFSICLDVFAVFFFFKNKINFSDIVV